MALAFLAAGALIARRLRELELPVDWAYEMIGAALAGGLIGARAYFLLQNGADGGVSHALLSGSGWIWYGGLLGGALAVGGWAWWRRPGWLLLLDLSAPALALGYSVGRIACQLTGDGTYGVPSHLPWAMGYPHGTDPTPAGVTVHPTPVYETIAMGLVALWLWRHRDAYRPGILFAWYLVLAGLERFLVELIRRNSEVIAGLTAAQLESAAMVAIGAACIVVVARRGGLHRPGAASEPPLEPIPAA